jgi:hypothetical protein
VISAATLIVHHSGRVVDMTGYNLMAEFSSVVDAVKCAVETQKEISKRDADLLENRQMSFRSSCEIHNFWSELLVPNERVDFQITFLQFGMRFHTNDTLMEPNTTCTVILWNSGFAIELLKTYPR